MLTPSKLFHCPLAMVSAAAEVKPAITGTEMKSIKKPSWRRPQRRMMIPDKKVKRTAY